MMVTLNPSQAIRAITVSAINTQIWTGGVPASVYEKEPFNIACLLRDSGGMPVIGRTVDFYYIQAGSTVYLGSATTGDAGNAELFGVSIPTLGQTYIRYEFSGDATYNSSWAEDGPFNVLESIIDTTSTISALSSVDVNQTFEISGQLTRNDTAAGVVGETINLSYNGVNLGSVITGGGGFYSLDVSIAEVGSFTLRAEFAGGVAFGHSVGTISIGVGVPALPPIDAPLIAAAGLVIADIALILAYAALKLRPP